jgi:hypothetical protein
MENQKVVVPLQVMIDVQLGPDGNPWIRMQFAIPSMSTSIVFPAENSEGVINMLAEGIRRAAKNATKRQVDTIPPDFTNIKSAWNDGKKF